MNVQVFNNAQFGEIRTAGTADSPLFCLADVCKALGLSAKGVNQRLGDEVISNYPIIDNLGREQKALFVNEDGLYDVILDSRKKSARAFRKWVTSEVLPSIRKTGGYVAAAPEMTDAEIMARALSIANSTINARNERIKELESKNSNLHTAVQMQKSHIEQQEGTIEEQKRELKAQAPKVIYYDEVLQSQNTMTTTQIAKGLGMEANTLNRKLRDAGIIFRQSGMWMLHAPYSRWNLHSVRTQTYTRSDGTVGTSEYTVWKNRGKRFIHALYENNFNVRKAISQIKSETNN